MRAYSIRWVLILVVLIAVLPGVIGTTFEVARGFQLQRNNALETAHHAADAAAQRVAGLLDDSISIARSAAELPAVASLDPSRCNAALHDLLTVLPFSANLIAIDAEGWLVCTGLPVREGGQRRIDPSYYFDRLKQTSALTIGYPSPSGVVSGRRIVGVAQPLLNTDGTLRGAVILAIDLMRFAPDMPREQGLLNYLLAGNGAIVSTNDNPEDRVARQPAPSRFFDPVAGPGGVRIETQGPDGRSYLVGKAAVAGYDWTMIAAIPTDAALAKAYAQLWRSATSYGIVMLLALSLAVYLGTYIAAPLKEMAELVERIGQGNRDLRFVERGPAEIQALIRQSNVALDQAQAQDKLLRIANQRIALAIEANQDGIWDWDLQNGQVDCNDRLLSMLGYERGDLLLQMDALKSLIHPDDQVAVKTAIDAHLVGATPYFVTEHRLRGKDGCYIWVLNRGAIVDRDQAGRPTRVIGTHTDIDARKEAEIVLRRAGVVFEKSPQAIMVTDERNIIQLVNPAFERVTGYAASEAIGRNPAFLSGGRQKPEFYKAMWSQLKAGGEWHGEIWNLRKDGSSYCEWLTISQMRNGDRISGYIGMFIDITKRKEAEAQVEWRASFDPLTALPNRHLLVDRIDQAVKRAKRTGHDGAVMMLDLDHFKGINDTLGHQAGDAVLVEVGRRLQKAMRDNDTISRLGGDEFVVVSSDVTVQQAGIVADRIQKALAVPIEVGGRQLQTGASIGIAMFPAHGHDPDELLRLADLAMYAAKSAGRGTWQIFRPEMDEQSQQRLDLITDLRAALERDEIELFYQPIVNMKTGKVTKAESLVRWHHPQHGYISPDQFVPLSEETGIIHQLGRAVMELGLAARRRINATGLACQIGINISSRQIEAASFAAETLQALAHEDMTRNPLVFEVTESVLLANFESTSAILREFSAAGVEIALDDFGTGYSSLNYLSRLPAKILKIDRSFIVEIDRRPDLARLVRTIIDLGHDLGLTIVAEGVETAAQRDILLAMGCDCGQGYYFAEAMPLDGLMARLALDQAVITAA